MPEVPKTVTLDGCEYGPAMMAGPLRNGAERGHGTRFHAARYQPDPFVPFVGAALCGASPSIMWSTWTDHGRGINCPRCLSRLRKLLKASGRDKSGTGAAA